MPGNSGARLTAGVAALIQYPFDGPKSTSGGPGVAMRRCRRHEEVHVGEPRRNDAHRLERRAESAGIP